ncbi:Golgi Transport [Elasticomyces elasticus]|nr:Golgi Transport [Elasticomyces elasticus]
MPTLWLSDGQKFGVAFCSGGFFFLVFGLILFFDRALLAMGNILFLVGITLLLGPARTFAFFARRNKWRGSAAFWAGILLILVRWTLVGFLVELYGMFILFGEYVEATCGLGEWWLTLRRFFKTIAGFAYNIPVVGPYLAKALQAAGDKAGANDRAHKDLPV